VKVQTHQGTVRRWQQRGIVIMNTNRPGLKKMLNEEQITWLVSPSTLQSMDHLYFSKRSWWCWTATTCPPFAPTCSRQYYLRGGLKFKRPEYCYWKT